MSTIKESSKRKTATISERRQPSTLEKSRMVKPVGPLSQASSNNLRFQKPVLIEDQQINSHSKDMINRESFDYIVNPRS
jgi:hypothetical protein